jgi:thiamine-monophosphate kinase
MAARPLGVLVALVLPEHWLADVGDLAEGIANAVRRAETFVVGGDISTGAELSLGITVLGSARKPVTRSGARSGDRLYVTGRLGGPGDALRCLRRGESPVAWCRARFAAPVARLAEGRWLAEHGASALIDVSDGLSADLAHLAAASGVSLRVQLERVPVGPGLSVHDAVASGEEYELLCTSPHELNRVAFEERFGVPLHPIGEVLAAAVPAILATHNGVRVDLAPGHDHFTR